MDNPLKDTLNIKSKGFKFNAKESKTSVKKLLQNEAILEK